MENNDLTTRKKLVYNSGEKHIFPCPSDIFTNLLENLITDKLILLPFYL